MDDMNFSQKYDVIDKFTTIAFSMLDDKNISGNLHKEKLSYPLNDTLINCYFNWILCSSNNFTTYFESLYGNCFTFESNLMNMSGQAYGLKTEMYVGCYEKLNVLNSFYGGIGAIIRIENGTALSGNIYDGFKLGLFLPDFYKHPSKIWSELPISDSALVFKILLVSNFETRFQIFDSNTQLNLDLQIATT